MAVLLGLTTHMSEKFTFRKKNGSLRNGINVSLKDKQENVFTLLNTNNILGFYIEKDHLPPLK
jgi:hypothetical protein